MRVFSPHLKDIPNLEELYLSANPFGDEGLKYLCDNLEYIPKLKKLGLSCNSISDAGGIVFIKSICKIEKMKNLWMSKNNISNYSVFLRKVKESHPNKSLSIDESHVSRNRNSTNSMSFSSIDLVRVKEPSIPENPFKGEEIEIYEDVSIIYYKCYK